jgi:hypothetical protein
MTDWNNHVFAERGIDSSDVTLVLRQARERARKFVCLGCSLHFHEDVAFVITSHAYAHLLDHLANGNLVPETTLTALSIDASNRHYSADSETLELADAFVKSEPLAAARLEFAFSRPACEITPPPSGRTWLILVGPASVDVAVNEALPLMADLYMRTRRRLRCVTVTLKRNASKVVSMTRWQMYRWHRMVQELVHKDTRDDRELVAAVQAMDDLYQRVLHTNMKHGQQ